MKKEDQSCLRSISRFVESLLPRHRDESRIERTLSTSKLILKYKQVQRER